MAQIPEIYSYWRSSASWRVRIALAYKGVDYEYRAVHLVRDGGEQHSDAYRAKNPIFFSLAMLIGGLPKSTSISFVIRSKRRSIRWPTILMKHLSIP